MVIILKSLLIWIAIIPCAFLNGGFRNAVLFPLLGESRAYIISGLLLCVFIFLITWFLLPLLKKGSRGEYKVVGIIWMILTILLETIIGLINGLSLREIFSSFDFRNGNLWLFIVLFIAVVPYIVAIQRKLIIDERRISNCI